MQKILIIVSILFLGFDPLQTLLKSDSYLLRVVGLSYAVGRFIVSAVAHNCFRMQRYAHFPK